MNTEHTNNNDKKGYITYTLKENQIIGIDEFLSFVRSGAVELVREIMVRQPELVNAKDRMGVTALMVAASRIDEYTDEDKSLNEDRLTLAKLLIKNGADVKARRTAGWDALTHAISARDHEMAKLLMESGADVAPNPSDLPQFFKPPLITALSNVAPPIVIRTLLLHGANKTVTQCKAGSTGKIIPFNGIIDSCWSLEVALSAYKSPEVGRTIIYDLLANIRSHPLTRDRLLNHPIHHDRGYHDSSDDDRWSRHPYGNGLVSILPGGGPTILLDDIIQTFGIESDVFYSILKAGLRNRQSCLAAIIFEQPIQCSSSVLRQFNRQRAGLIWRDRVSYCAVPSLKALTGISVLRAGIQYKNEKELLLPIDLIDYLDEELEWYFCDCVQCSAIADAKDRPIFVHDNPILLINTSNSTQAIDAKIIDILIINPNHMSSFMSQVGLVETDISWNTYNLHHQAPFRINVNF